MEIVTSPSMIVPEVLKEDNYERWCILMEHYLVAQDLWDVVRSSEIIGGGSKREWMKKNALALHAIGISCGREAFDQIKNKRSAKVAWDALAAKLKPPSIVQDVTPVISEPHQERQTGLLAGQHEKLQKLVCCESISEVKQFLDSNQGMMSPQMLDSALKHAITCGRKKMARYLYREIPLDFLRADSGFFLLEHCITNGMFDIALGLLHDSSHWASRHPSNSTPIVLILAQTAPPFLSINELGSWGRWIYKSTRVKAFPIKPRSAPAGGIGIVQDKLREWILPVLYKFHLVCVMIGLLCWMPCWLPGVRINELDMLFAFELLLLLVVPLLKLDLLCVLIGVPLFWLLVGHGELIRFLKEFAVFILLLVILRVILRKLDKEPSRKPELPRILRIAAEPLRMPIGVPLLLLGAPISLSISDKGLKVSEGK